MKTVFITRRLPRLAEDLLAKRFKVVANRKNQPITRRQLSQAIVKYDAILSTVSDQFDADLLAQKKKLQVISNYAAGLDNIDLQSARKNKVAVYNAPGVVTESTADLTFALLLSLVRQVGEARQFVRQNKWRGWNPEMFLGEELSGKTFGIIGLGKIGQAVARRAAGFGLRVIYCRRPRSKSPQVVIDAHLVTLATLFKESDYISLHLPLNQSTRHLINRQAIKQMKKRPIIINLARGAVIETAALLTALRSGQLRGACLDVTAPEPLAKSHPLFKLENCLIVPHIGTATLEGRQAMAKLAAENIINHFLHEAKNRRPAK